MTTKSEAFKNIVNEILATVPEEIKGTEEGCLEVKVTPTLLTAHFSGIGNLFAFQREGKLMVTVSMEAMRDVTDCNDVFRQMQVAAWFTITLRDFQGRKLVLTRRFQRPVARKKATGSPEGRPYSTG